MTPTQQLRDTMLRVYNLLKSPSAPDYRINEAARILDATLANSRATEGTASGVTVKVNRSRVWIVSGVQSFMLDYEADTDEELQWYAGMLRGALAGKPATRAGAEPSSTGILHGDPAPSMSMFATMDDYKQAKAEHAKPAPTKIVDLGGGRSEKTYKLCTCEHIKALGPGCKCEPGDCWAINSRQCKDWMKRGGKS